MGVDRGISLVAAQEGQEAYEQHSNKRGRIRTETGGAVTVHPHVHRLLGGRKQRLKALRSASEHPVLSMSSQNVQVECLGYSDDPFSVLRLKRFDMKWTKVERSLCDDDAFIAVEATAIGPLDVAVRRGIPSETLPVPFILGSNFVGVVQHCGSQAKQQNGIDRGSRVTSVMMCGGNARFITMPANTLMVVPKRLDAAEISCIVSTYLPAFQALHHGIPRPHRYSPSFLKDKRVLITGACILEAQAITWLAKYAGAAQVFVTASRNHYERLVSHQAIPVKADPAKLFTTLDGFMDVIIDFEFPKYLHVARAIMADNGRLVCCAPPKVETSLCCLGSIDFIWEQSTLCLVDGATLFNFFDSWKNNPDDVKEDLWFLLGLLHSRHLRPPIDRFISLSGIPRAHQDLQIGNVEGSIICEPWKD